MIGIEFCGNCRFFADHECRRFPPQITLYATDNQHPVIYDTIAQYPYVMDTTGCCGEFKAREQEPLRAER